MKNEKKKEIEWQNKNEKTEKEKKRRKREKEGREKMRSELSKLPKDLLIEIIEKGFSFEDLKLHELKKKEKEIQEEIERRKEDIVNQIRNIKIGDYTKVRYISDIHIFIRKEYDDIDISIEITNHLYVTIKRTFQNTWTWKSFINDNIDELMVGFTEYLSEGEIWKIKEILLMLKGSIW